MDLYSIKMRSSRENKHISGAEKIVYENDLDEAINLLVKRAIYHSKGKSDFIKIKVESINENEIEYLEPLEVTTVKVKDCIEGMEAVKIFLRRLGVQEEKLEKIITMLKENGSMRGAIILDVNTLERLEPDKNRGIRATYMDFEGGKINYLTKDLKSNAHFIEALALATKVSNAPHIIGEICYSDDPNYTAGYIASKEYGYIRFPHLKELGDNKGGRIFLYDSTKENIEETIDYIEKSKIIIRDKIVIKEDLDYDLIRRGIC